MDAKLSITEWKEKQIISKQEECKIWWRQQKEKIQKLMKEKINT